MDPNQPAPGTTASVAVTYEAFGGARNPELRGKGILTVSGGKYRFSGRKRGLQTDDRIVEIEFSAGEIRNVTAVERAVTFANDGLLSGRRGQRFLFYCRTPEDAREAAALLPAAQDEDHAAGLQFHAQIRSLPGVRSRLSVTNVIIALNVAVFLVMSGVLGGGWVEVSNLTPYILYGANNGAATTDGEWWRLFTSMFMHYGLIHLTLNMWALYQAGRLVEALQGRLLYAFTYLASGVGGGLLSIDWHGDKIWSVGASGAIFGVYGALLGHMWSEKDVVPKSVFQPIMKSTLTFAGYNLFYGTINSAIDNSAHIGGFATGLVLGWLTAMPPGQAIRARLLPRKLWQGAAATAVIVAAGVWWAPHFNFSVRDELTFQAAVKDIAAEEAPLLERENAQLRQWDAAADNGPELTALIDEQLIPYYDRFVRTLESLLLRPGLVTCRRRDILVQSLQFKLEGLRHLSRGVRQNDPGEIALYRRAESESQAAIAASRDIK